MTETETTDQERSQVEIEKLRAEIRAIKHRITMKTNDDQ